MTFADFDNVVTEEKKEETIERKKNFFFDILNDLYHTKKYIFSEDIVKDYKPFLINRYLSGNIDTVLFSQELNERPHLTEKMQFDYYFYSIRKKKRFSKWMKREEDENVEAIMKYYNYNRRRAVEVLKLHTNKQLELIKERINLGGKEK